METSELEIVLADWLKLNQDKMTYSANIPTDLEQFDHEILSMENPQMLRYLIQGESLLPELLDHDTKYVRILVDYV